MKLWERIGLSLAVISITAGSGLGTIWSTGWQPFLAAAWALMVIPIVAIGVTLIMKGNL